MGSYISQIQENDESNASKIQQERKDTIYYIGSNFCHQFGMNEEDDYGCSVSNFQLSALKTTENMTNVSCGDWHNIYYDNKQNYWSAGNNMHGQCAVKVNSNWWSIIAPNNEITTLTKINYFKNKNISIKQVYTRKYCTFWSTTTGQTYGNGWNSEGELGINDTKSRHLPQLIPELINVLQIQTTRRNGAESDGYTVALCAIDDFIVAWFCRKYTENINIIPHDIVQLIGIFAGNKNMVFSTLKGPKTVKLKPFADCLKFQKVELFDDKNIIKISSGRGHSLFLEDNGDLWCFGRNYHGEMGIGKTDKRIKSRMNGFVCCRIPIRCQNERSRPLQKIVYFVRNKIKIIDIKCGEQHNLAIDSEYRVYSWGSNWNGQCGDGTMQSCIPSPILIPFEEFSNGKIRNIECGNYHSGVCVDDGIYGKWYLFGNNGSRQCMKKGENSSFAVSTPYFINDIVKAQCDGKEIESVHLGNYTTMIICIDSKQETVIKNM